MLIHNCEQRTELWYQLKTGRFSASTFSKLMGKKTNKGYTDEIYRIACEKITGERVEGYQNDAMRRGIELEPEARLWYETEKNVFVKEVGFIEVDEWVGVSPDGLIGIDGMLEIKCPLQHTHLEYLLEEKLPSVYKYQVQGQLWVAQREWCDFVSYHPKMKKLIIRVERDESIINELKSSVLEAIDEVQQIIKKLEK